MIIRCAFIALFTAFSINPSLASVNNSEKLIKATFSNNFEKLKSKKKFEIISASIRGDTLVILIRASGHADSDRSYSLVFGRGWMESYPVRIKSILLMGDSLKDDASLYFEERKYFDLRPLKNEYKKAYRIEYGKIGFGFSEHPLLYEFDDR